MKNTWRIFPGRKKREKRLKRKINATVDSGFKDILKTIEAMKKLIPIILFSLLSSITGLSQSRVKIIEIKPLKPKPKKPTPPPPDKGWTITFEMTVTGQGTVKDDDGSGTETSWSINRIYKGRAELNYSWPEFLTAGTPAEIHDSFIAGRITNWTHMSPSYKAEKFSMDQLTIPIQVIINDELKTLVKEKGEGGSFENSTTTKHWKANDDARADNIRLLIDKKVQTYNVWIPLNLIPDILAPGTLTLSSTTLYERSPFGYGDLPTSQTVAEDDRLLSIGSIGIPKVKGFVKGGIIHPFMDLSLKEVDGGFEFDSGDNQPEEPLISGLPESKTNVKVHFYYRFNHKK